MPGRRVERRFRQRAERAIADRHMFRYLAGIAARLESIEQALRESPEPRR